MTKAYSTYGENRNAERILCGKSEGSRQLRRARVRWENGIKINFKKLMWKGGIDKSGSGYGASGGLFEHDNEISAFKKWGQFLE